MTSRMKKRLPGMKSLYEMLPKGTEGGKEFARIVDLLLFHEGRRSGKNVTIFSDTAGDYHGLDSFEHDDFRQDGTIGYQYKFYPSPLSSDHRRSIEEALKITTAKQKQLKLKKWILVTPQDFIESATRKSGGDVTWFEGLRDQLGLDFGLEHWGYVNLLDLFLETPSLCLFYYPELINGMTRKKTIEDIRKRYDDNLLVLYRDIQFVGMSVKKQEAIKGVPIEDIYISLRVIPETHVEQDEDRPYTNPLSLLSSGNGTVILGEPGSGKSTLLRFLALVGISQSLQERCDARPDKRLPIIVTLSRYADELKSRSNLSLIDYIQESIQADFSLKDADLEFFEYYLETGQTLLFFDGLDELPSSHFKQTIRDRIRTLITTYPGNTTIVTSRIVGYDNPFRFDEKEFGHYQMVRLQLSEIELFVKDWYRTRIKNEREREANINDLIRIINDRDHIAIRELAENPLLLTIIALVHRVDAELPDERVVLYQKCTETLLNTWQTGKHHNTEIRNKAKVDRRNRHRVEAIAFWMHSQSGDIQQTQRAIVPSQELKNFLCEYITKVERLDDRDNDPEDLATDFLEFIEKQAGLLIEVGAEQYSFVHLTFQEYLASTYILRVGEPDGVREGIWKVIKDHCSDPRWHEVIRLVVAGLKNNDSQRVLIEEILSEEIFNQQRSQLLGGLLLDGIDGVEGLKKEIVMYLLRSASVVEEDKQLKPISTLLRTLRMKENVGEEVIFSALQTLLQDMVNERQKIALVLVGFIIDLPEARFIELVQNNFIKETRVVNLFGLFLNDETKTENFALLTEDIELLWAWQDCLLLISPLGSLFAAASQAINNYLGTYITAKRAFQELMIALSCGTSTGPFKYYVLNSLRACSDRTAINPIFLPLIDEIKKKYSTPWNQPLVLEIWLGKKKQPFDWKLARVQDLTLDRALASTLALVPALFQDEVLSRAIQTAQNRIRIWNQDRILLDWIQLLGSHDSNALSELWDRPLVNALTRLLDKLRVWIQSKNWSQDMHQKLAKVSGRNASQALADYLDKVVSSALYQNQGKIKLFIIESIDIQEWITEKRISWQEICIRPEFNILTLYLLCEIFKLEPRVQWLEALRVSFLSNIPQRIDLFDQETWTYVESSFANNNAGEAEVYNAAWQLLFDSWLHLFGYYDRHGLIGRTPFDRLVELTCHNDSPPLRIAHCIRDLAYGDGSRMKDLISMIKSDDPEYRSIFEECLWYAVPKKET